MDKNKFLKNMGVRLIKARLDKGYTQEYLGEIVNLSAQSISCAENGKKMMKLENFIKICTSLDVSADYLLFGTENRSALSVSEDDFAKMSSEQRESLKAVIDNCIKMCN